MTPAPLPPHERQWRHPSELAPTITDVESSSHGRGLIIATGATAAMLAAVMVIAVTPPRSSSPSAVSATTIAAASTQQQQNTARGSVERPEALVRFDRSTVTCDDLLAHASTPKGASSALDAANPELATRIPNPDEPIIVLTNSHACSITWSQIDRVIAPDGAFVVTQAGEVVGEFVDGEFSVLVD